MTLTDLRADWQARLDEAVELRDRRDAAGEPIPMGAEDTARFRGLMDAADDLEMRIRELETEKRDHDSALRRLDAAQERAQLRAGDAPPLPGAATTRATAGDGRGAFMAYMARGPEQARQATDYAQLRALQVDSDTGGGYLIMPMSIHADLIREVDDALIMRQISMVQPRLAVGQSLLAAIDDDSMDEAAWTGELTEIPEDDLNPLGQRRLEPRRLAKRFKISNELLMAPGFNHEAYWLMRAARKLQEPQEKAFMTGTGANQPLGIFTAHSGGDPDQQGREHGQHEHGHHGTGHHGRVLLAEGAVHAERAVCPAPTGRAPAQGAHCERPVSVAARPRRHGAGNDSRPTVHHVRVRPVHLYHWPVRRGSRRFQQILDCGFRTDDGAAPE